MINKKEGRHKEKSKKLYCSKCSSGISSNIKLKKDKNGDLSGNCPCCKEKDVVFTDKLPDSKKAKHPMETKAEQKKELAKHMEISREEAARLNKELAKTRRTVKKETIKEKEDKDIEKIKEKMKDPNLLVDTVKEIQKEVAGEEDTILAEIIITSTRLVKNAIPESTNFLLSDKTGLGKDHVTKKTLEVILPEEEHLHVTKMSPESFTYWHYKDKDWTWDRKVIHVEDVTQQLLNCPTFKTMSSGGSFAVIVKDQQTLEIPTPGKPCMILTSHHANPKDEALRRFRIGSLNETKGQTQKVKDNISRQYTGEAKIKPDYTLRNAVQSLDSYFVMISYARIIQYFFPDDILMRTHYHCFLDYICGSAIFHQYQREKTEKGEIIATPDDYMIARMVLIYTTSNPKMIPMSEDYREILNILENNVNPMTVHDIFLKCNQSERWLYRHLPELTKTGLIVKNKKDMEDSKKPVTTYQFSLELNASAIPTWNKITRIMDDIYKKIVKTDKCVKCSNPTTEVEKVQNYICQELSNVSNEKERKRHLQQLTGLSNIPNGRELTQMTELSMFLRERDEKRYRKYYKEFIPTEEKSNQKTLDQVDKIRKIQDFCETAKNKDGFVKEKSVIAFVKNVLHKKDPESHYQHLLQNGDLTFYSGKGVMFTRG